MRHYEYKAQEYVKDYIKNFKDSIDQDVIDETWVLDCVIQAIEKAAYNAHVKGNNDGYAEGFETGRILEKRMKI